MVDFLWSLFPADAGTLAPDGNTCTVTWNPDITDNCAVRVQGIDACGPGNMASTWVSVGFGQTIVQQPQPISVEVGDEFQLSVTISLGGIPGAWYKVGSGLITSGNSYWVGSATMEMNGLYHWAGGFNFPCSGFLNSDTVEVEVTDISTSIRGNGTGMLTVWPNPARNKVDVHWRSIKPPDTMRLLDGSGREVPYTVHWNAAHHMISIGLEALHAGIYLLEFRSDEGVSVARVIKE